MGSGGWQPAWQGCPADLPWSLGDLTQPFWTSGAFIDQTPSAPSPGLWTGYIRIAWEVSGLHPRQSNELSLSQVWGIRILCISPRLWYLRHPPLGFGKLWAEIVVFRYFFLKTQSKKCILLWDLIYRCITESVKAVFTFSHGQSSRRCSTLFFILSYLKFVCWDP